jgi:hypothetical protein
MSDTPYFADLMATVAQLYARLPARLPSTLEACLCPVCMTPETLADIIATPVRQLTRQHLDEYRNSAHGVPINPNDLRAILPRYLDMMARGEWSDVLGVGADLQRFGDGRRVYPDLFDARTTLLLNQWARLMILHTGAAEVMDQDTDYGTHNLTEVLLVGGWPVDVITSALDDLFASANGHRAQQLFIRILGQGFARDRTIQMWALSQYRAEAIPAFVDWLNDLLCRQSVQAWLLSPDVFHLPWADPLFTISGNITPAAFAKTQA